MEYEWNVGRHKIVHFDFQSCARKCISIFVCLGLENKSQRGSLLTYRKPLVFPFCIRLYNGAQQWELITDFGRQTGIVANFLAIIPEPGIHCISYHFWISSTVIFIHS